MKVTIVHGSARKNGNSHSIVNALCEGFTDDTEIKNYEMQTLNTSGCIGCMSCKTKYDRCALEDDLAQVFEDMRSSDILVLASPVYFGDVSAQAKIFIDRLYHLFTPDFHDGIDENGQMKEAGRYTRLKSGTQMVFITAQGSIIEEHYGDIHTRYGNFFNWLGFEKVHSIRGLGDPANSPDTNNMNAAIGRARALVKELCA